MRTEPARKLDVEDSAMPNLLSLLLRLLVGGMLIFTSIVPALGQEATPQLNDNREAWREWWGLSKGRTEFEVSDLASLPSRLILAARHSGSGCRIEEGIADSPVKFTKIESRQLAIVFCPSIIGTHEVFDLTDVQRPRL